MRLVCKKFGKGKISKMTGSIAPAVALNIKSICVQLSSVFLKTSTHQDQFPKVQQLGSTDDSGRSKQPPNIKSK